LKGYLETAETSTVLLCNNLERIAHLIDAFRQVAVNGQMLEKQVFRLKDCLDEVIRSLGDRLPAERVAIEIECEPNLEIESLPDDWVSIFANLIGNSLKHGFRDRERGLITIQMSRDTKKLRVDYRDDGAGLTPDVLNRIFDPFFTTDLQHGMGLGMHLVYNLISHRLGGTIHCDSQPGEGVHFHIEVPV
jgi:signal transduction histidine kinase